MTGIVGPVDGLELLTIVIRDEVVASASGTDETYIVKDQNVQSIFEDCSISTVEDIERLQLEERDSLFSAVSGMLLTALLKL